MSEWAMRRFWTDVTVEDGEGGYAICLDGRPVMTPAKRRLAVPTETIASRVAAEWQAQTGTVDPTTMPWTRSANAALDKVATQRDEVAGHLIGYAGTDLLSYRADAPEALVERQREHWDPVLDWLATRFGVRLSVTRGVMPVLQPQSALERLAETMAPMTHFQLTGFHDLVTLSGSFTLALAVAQGERGPEQAWGLSRLDEDWQIEQWGEDEEAAEHAEIKRQAFLHAAEFYQAA